MPGFEQGLVQGCSSRRSPQRLIGKPCFLQKKVADSPGSPIGGGLRHASEVLPIDPGSREVHHAAESAHAFSTSPRSASAATNRETSSRRRSSGTSYSASRA